MRRKQVRKLKRRVHAWCSTNNVHAREVHVYDRIVQVNLRETELTGSPENLRFNVPPGYALHVMSFPSFKGEVFLSNALVICPHPVQRVAGNFVLPE